LARHLSGTLYANGAGAGDWLGDAICRNPPQEALSPPWPHSCLPSRGTAAGSGRPRTSLNSKESNVRVPSGGAVAVEQGGRRGGWCVPWPGCGGGLGGKPCTPPCRGSSLLGPEEARSPVLICTYPYTRSCRCKGSTGGLIGH